jgi:hypothetical protein
MYQHLSFLRPSLSFFFKRAPLRGALLIKKKRNKRKEKKREGESNYHNLRFV